MLVYIIYNVAVLSLFLCDIQSFIRLHEKLVIALAVNGISGYSHWTSKTEVLEAVGKCSLRVGADSSEDTSQFLLAADIFKNNKKTAAAHSSCDTAAADFSFDYARNSVYHFITEKMSVTCVDVAKVVDIQQYQIHIVAGFLSKDILCKFGYGSFVEKSG